MPSNRLGRCLLGSLSFSFLVAGVAAAGCAASETSESDIGTTKPHLMALSTYAASLGTPIDAFMANPPPSDAQKIELVFDGKFTRSDGSADTVSFSQPTSRTDAGAIRWGTFGPFANPFTPTNPDIGVFEGKVGVKVTLHDGTTVMDDKPMPVHFEVKPSIIVTDLQPTTATCDKPALRLIGAMGYKMKAQALGFKPTSIEYSFQTPSVIPDQVGNPAFDTDSDGKMKYTTRKIAHTMATNTDAIDEKDAILLPPVPLDQPNYGVVFAIVAKDDQGHQVASTFGMTAHNPIEVFYDNRFQLAQIYPAEPVSGCMPGGQSTRAVNYSEAHAETRSRMLSVTISKTFMHSDENNWSTSDGKTISHGTTNTDGYSQTHGTQNTFSFTKSHSDTTGVTFDWSDSHANTSGWMEHGEGKVSFKPFGIGAELGGGAQHDSSSTDTHTTGGSKSSSSTDGWTQGQSNTTLDQSTIDHSTATTDSTAVTNTNTKGGSQSDQQGTSQADQDAWTVSSTDTIQKGFAGTVIANTYGVFYRQMARYTRRAFVLVYNKCGEGDVVGDVTLQDYIWAPDLALSEKCPPLPNSNFPEPQCYLPPCDP